MRVLIFSVTAGQGHNTTARVLAESLTARGHETKVVDTFRETNRLYYLTYDKGYLFASSLLAPLYGWGYYGCEKRKSNSYHKSFARLLYRGVAKKLAERIEEYDPDVIVTTHPVASFIVDIVKERHGFRAATVGISTDFTMHPYWEEALRFDRVVIPNEQLFDAARKKGFEDEQILPIGIPINPTFAERTAQSEARRALGLPEDLPIFLIMSGSMGHGNMKKTLRTLSKMPERFGIVTVCGNNKKAYRAIEKKHCDKLLLTLGYTKKVSLLMDAADCLISKPGGLTTSEALAKHLPMLSCDPIPGQEIRNEQFLSAFGAVLPASGARLEDAAKRFLTEKGLKDEMKGHISLIRKPNATLDLCREIEQLYSQNQK